MSIYCEIDAAIAAIDDLDMRNDAEFQDVLRVRDILEKNNTIGITMEDGRELKKMGIDIDLDELSHNRVHIGNEELVTAAGKTGLYGLAIGALVAVIGFIVVKLFKWFKNRSGGSSDTSSSPKNAEKAIPSMSGGSTSRTLKVPKVLGHPDDFKEFLGYYSNFVSSVRSDLKTLEDLDDGVEKEIVEKKVLELAKDLLSEVKYKLKADNVDGVKAEVADLDEAKLPYLQSDTVEIEVGNDKLQIGKSIEKDMNDLHKSLKDKADDKGLDDKGKALAIRLYAGIAQTVLSKNFTKIIGIVGTHNAFLDRKMLLDIRAYGPSAVADIKKRTELHSYFSGGDISTQANLSKGFDKIIAAGKGTGITCINAHKEIGDLTEKHSKDIESKLSGTTSSKKDKK